MSRSAATNWTRGYKTYRNGVAVGFVPPLDRLAVRQISTRYLSQDERIEIADLHHSGLRVRTIATRLGRAPSTISRELRRNAPAGRGYQPFDATGEPPRDEHVTTAVGSTPTTSSVTRSPSCFFSVGAPTDQPSPPPPLPDDSSMWLCHESIYQAVYQPNSRFMRPRD
ncbi:helix-turn-helix domain protein [Mycobacterium avium MAV_120809_2495]|nr:helix-turn-helix domain protein [Mycobacterium avium MAV_120809_2495]